MRVLAVGVLLVGCGSGLSGVSLATDRAQYSAGDSAALSLANGTGGDVGYNLCGTSLERHADDGTWGAASADRVCAASLLILRPFGRASSSEGLSSPLAPGEYRFVTWVSDESAHLDVTVSSNIASNTFTVR